MPWLRSFLIWTVRQFDDAYTAPNHGFRDAADYYYRASALRVVDRIRVPTLVITAEDDPFVPTLTFRDAAVTRIPIHRRDHCTRRTLRVRGTPEKDYDGYWAEREIVRFIDHQFARDRGAASVASRTPVPSLPLHA